MKKTCELLGPQVFFVVLLKERIPHLGQKWDSFMKTFFLKLNEHQRTRYQELTSVIGYIVADDVRRAVLAFAEICSAEDQI